MADLERRHEEWFAAASDAAYDEMYQRWMPDDVVRRLAEDQRNFEVAIERAVRPGRHRMCTSNRDDLQGVSTRRAA